MGTRSLVFSVPFFVVWLLSVYYIISIVPDATMRLAMEFQATFVIVFALYIVFRRLFGYDQ